MDSKIDFLYLSEPDMIKAGVKDMKSCVDVMEDLLITLYKGDYVMGGANHNSHGCMIMFPDDPQFPGMPKNADDRRFMAMPAYLGGSYQMAGMKWYGKRVPYRSNSWSWREISGAKRLQGSFHYRTWCYGKNISGSFRQCLPEPGYGENKGKKPAVSGCFYPVYQGGTASDQKY